MNMEKPSVRVAMKKDAGAIDDLISEWSKREWPHWQVERREIIVQALEDKNHLILVASTTEKIADVLHLIFYSDVVTGALNCHLNFLLVKEEYRRKGIGHNLLKEAIRQARQKGANEMHVDTIFEDAATFYRKYDFKDDGVWLELSLREHEQR